MNRHLMRPMALRATALAPAPVGWLAAGVRGLAAVVLGAGLAPALMGQADDLAGLMSVEARHVQRAESYRVERSYWGRVEARREVQAGFRIGGLIDRVRVDLGDAFEAGDLLATLQSAQAEAQVLVAEAQLEVAQQSRALAEEALERLTVVDRAGFASDADIDTASRTLQIRLAEVEAAGRQLRQAREALADHRLLAPWHGRVQQRMLDEGAVVSPGVPLLHLVEDGHLQMRVGLPHALAASLAAGGGATRHNLRLGERTVQVALSRLAPATSSGSRTRPAIFDLPPGVGTPGQGAELRLGVEFRRPGYWVPVQALSQLRKGLWSLMVLDLTDDDGVASIGQRVVEILHLDNDRAYVDGALQPDELVVVSSVAELVAGQRVRFNTAQARRSPTGAFQP